jgi:hypothetical protein
LTHPPVPVIRFIWNDTKFRVKAVAADGRRTDRPDTSKERTNVMSRTLFRSSAAAALMLLSTSLARVDVAAAQQYPAQPITFVVSTTPGASPDIVARLFAQHL